MIEDRPVLGKVLFPGSDNNLAGIGLMVSGMFMLAMMDVVEKWLVE